MRRFGELEAVIMDRLWEWERPVLVREMVDALHDDRALAYTTVMTVMENLYRKGWLRRERDGRAWRYEPTRSRSSYTAALMSDALGTRMLGGAKWTARAPLLAIVTYLAAGWSVVAAFGLAGLTLAVHATALGGGLSDLIGACVHRLQATYGTPGGATVAGLGLTLAGAVAARTVLTATAHLRATGRQALRHAQTARLVGHPEPALGAILVEHSQPAAYCVAGRQPTVILTTGAVQALDPGQLDAVLAHERAHLAGRHHWLVAMARIGHEVLPFLPLMRDAEEQVARMVELHADDAATRARDPRLLAAALVVLTTSGSAAPALALTPVLLALTPAMVALALGKLPGA